MIFTTLDTSQLKIIDDYKNIYSVNPLYLMIGKVDGYITENNGNKYLVFTSMELYPTDEKKKILKKYRELWDGIKNEIETINGSKTGKYDKDFIKIKFESDCDWGIKSFGNFAIATSNGIGYRYLMFDMTEEDVIDFGKNFEPDEL